MTESPAAESAPAPTVTFKKRGARPKTNMRKREKPQSSSESSSEDDAPQSRKAKRRQQAPGGTEANKTDELFATVFEAERKVDLGATNDATRERSKIGPTQAATNVRMTTMIDYAPDVCKDYKQTGFCGFGDNCKFLHDRSDYKQGWQLDKDWENVTKGRRNLGGTVVASADRDKKRAENDDDDEDEDERMLDNIPFACVICRGPYKSPVVTRCGHYFCEGCALARYRKEPGCAACGAGTGGVFNAATRLKRLLEKKKERERRKREAAIEAGEEVSSEEEDDEE
ncbi:hypothetical protein VUR80DRAFT_5570 [Thermomyces stellatus]